MVLFVFRREVIAHFINTGGIVGYRCLNFFFHNLSPLSWTQTIPWYMSWEILVMVWDKHKLLEWLSLLLDSQLSPLDNLILQRQCIPKQNHLVGILKLLTVELSALRFILLRVPLLSSTVLQRYCLSFGILYLIIIFDTFKRFCTSSGYSLQCVLKVQF
jgi:hypothetical protein